MIETSPLAEPEYISLNQLHSLPDWRNGAEPAPPVAKATALLMWEAVAGRFALALKPPDLAII